MGNLSIKLPLLIAVITGAILLILRYKTRRYSSKTATTFVTDKTPPRFITEPKPTIVKPKPEVPPATLKRSTNDTKELTPKRQKSVPAISNMIPVSYTIKIASLNLKAIVNITYLTPDTACFRDNLRADFYGIQEASFTSKYILVNHKRIVTLSPGSDKFEWGGCFYKYTDDKNKYPVGTAIGISPSAKFTGEQYVKQDIDSSDNRCILYRKGYFENKNRKFLFATMLSTWDIEGTYKAKNEAAMDKFFADVAEYLREYPGAKFALIGRTDYDTDEMDEFIGRMRKKHKITLNMPRLPAGVYTEATTARPSSTQSLEHLITNATVVESYNICSPMCGVFTNPLLATLKLTYEN